MVILMKNKDEYVAVHSKRMAVTIEFLSGLTYYIHDNTYEEGKKIYTFKNTNELQKVLAYIDNGRKILRD